MTIAEIVIVTTVVAPIMLMFLGLLFGTKFASEVWDALCEMWGATWEMLLPTPKAIEAKLTLDEMGMTLEQASDAHYDAHALNRIKQMHRLHHQGWDQEFKRIEKLENDDPDIVDEVTGEEFTIRDFSGNIIRQSRANKVTHRNGMTHSTNEVCYKCDRKVF